MTDSLQIHFARLVPQPGEIWEVVIPMRWQKYTTANHMSCVTFTLHPGDKILIRSINQWDPPGDLARNNAEIMWFNEQGWCILRDIANYCVRVDTWDNDHG